MGRLVFKSLEMNASSKESQLQHLPYKAPQGRLGVYEMLWKVRAVELINSMYPEVESRKGVRILDFGSGRGELLKMLRDQGYEVYGIDLDPECVKLASQFGPCVQGTYTDLKRHFSEKYFDVVCALHVLEHLPAPVEAVKVLAWVTKSFAVFSVPNLCTPVRLEYKWHIRLSVNAGHIVGWDFSHFKNFIEVHCGLKVVRFLPDVVQVPHFSNLLWKLGVGEKMEAHWLPRVFPYLSHSITALCKIP